MMSNVEEYLEAQVMTATPHQLHLMVVEGAIRHAKQAEQALAENDVETSHFALNRSREFVNELVCGLKPEPAEDLVTTLRALFGFVYKKLAEADLDHDPQQVRDALRVLEIHRETWVALGETLRGATVRVDAVDEAADTGRSWVS